MKNLILDVHNIAWRSYHAKAYKWMSCHRGLSGHIYGSIKQVLKMIQEADTKDFRIVFAYDKWPKRKLDIDPNYKGNRSPHPDSPVKDVKSLFNMIPSEIVWAEDEECDDVIASYVYKHKDEMNIINTTDKDLWQLLALPNVFIKTDHFIGEADLQKRFKLPLKQCYKVVIHKAIYGDSMDNIPNLCLRFRWTDIEPVFLACDGTPDSFITEAKKILPKKKIDKLLAKEERMRMNYDLACLKKDIDYVSIANVGNKTRLECSLMSWSCMSVLQDIEMINFI